MNENFINLDQVYEAVLRASAIIKQNEAYLNELDAVVGDGEHGFNLSQAFFRVSEKLPNLPKETMGDFLKSIGRELVASGGGAGTTFYGTAFMAAGKCLTTSSLIDSNLLVTIMEVAVEDIRKRGNASLGDKTMIDALVPALQAVRAGVLEENLKPCEALAKAALAALNGAKKTKEMLGKKGRGLYAGERALGTPDPGATSSCLILSALANIEVQTPI